MVESLRYVWSKLEKKATELGWPEAEIEAEKQKVAIKNFRGIDKDNFLSKVAKRILQFLVMVEVASTAKIVWIVLIIGAPKPPKIFSQGHLM